MMKNFRTLFLLGLSLVLLVSCNPKQTDDLNLDGLNQVSQYESRPFDDVKRAGVFYQIFVRSFADSNGDNIGDINGITAKLDYLHDLGVTGIWLTPIHPSGSYHGYDVMDYTDIDPLFGTLEDFDRLLSEAHARNIRVILDYVINHASINHPYYKAASQSLTSSYRDYFIFSKDPAQDIADGNIAMIATEGGSGYESGQWYDVFSGTKSYKYHSHFWTGSFVDWNYGPVENARESGAYQYIVESAKFWLDRGVDGFRLDAVKHIYHNATSDENPEFLRMFYEDLNSYFTGKSFFNEPLYMIGEVLSEHNEVAPYYKALPAFFDFSSWYRLEYAIKNSHAKWFPKDMLSYQAEYAAVRSDFIDATKLSNHDETRTRSALGGNDEVNLGRTKIAGAILLTSIGTPYIYYGEEIGMIGKKDNGDENVREGILWESAATDSYRTGKNPANRNNTEDKIGTVESQSKDSKSVYNTYRYFLRLRNTYPALAYGTMALPEWFKDSDSSNKQVMAFVREYASEKLLVLHNVSSKESVYTFTASNIVAIGDMNRVTYQKLESGDYQVTMPAYSSIIFEYK